jgi:pimeloyl-ACP methyl ester carboxylesterase
MPHTGEHELSLHGHRVRYLMAGDGPPVVLIHGITSSADTWRPAMRMLAGGHTVIAPDQILRADDLGRMRPEARGYHEYACPRCGSVELFRAGTLDHPLPGAG